MYILSDCFIGNVRNSKESYLEGNVFKYTNDGKEYRSTTIDIKDLYKGKLTKFYTYATIYDWIDKDILALIADKIVTKIIDGEEVTIVHLSVKIDKDNNITGIMAVDEAEVEGKIVVAPNEEIIPKTDSKVTVYRDKEQGMHFSAVEDKGKEVSGLVYFSFFCIPSMKYHKVVEKYIFDTKITFSYESN